MTPAERVREIQAYYQFDLSLLNSLDRLLAENGIHKQVPSIFFTDRINADPNDMPSFSQALGLWLQRKEDLVPGALHEMTGRIGWPEQMRQRVAGGAVNSSELWARAFPADQNDNPGWAILISEGLFSFFKDVLALIFMGVLIEKDQVQIKETLLESDSKRLAELLGSFLEIGMPSLGFSRNLAEGQRELCDVVYEAGIEFILFHELMHVQQGHHEAAAARETRTTLLEEAVPNHREEFEADRLGFGILLRTWKGRHGIAFAGASLLLQSLMLLERYPSQLQARRTHPPAAERLLRMRADAPKVFSLLQDRLDEVRSFENGLSRRLQLISDELPQVSEAVASPWNDLFRKCADIQTSPVPESLQLQFLSQAVSWIVLGDFQITCSGLGELWKNADTNLRRLKGAAASPDPADLSFYANACALIARLTDWLGGQGETGKRAVHIIETAKAPS